MSPTLMKHAPPQYITPTSAAAAILRGLLKVNVKHSKTLNGHAELKEILSIHTKAAQ